MAPTYSSRACALGLLVAATLGAAGPADATASATIGETFATDAYCAPGAASLQVASPGSAYAARDAGVITEWSFAAPESYAGGQVGEAPASLEVARPRGGALRWLGASDNVEPTPGELGTFATRIPVKAGDMIGLRAFGGRGCSRFANASYAVQFSETGGAPPNLVYGQPGAGAQLNVSALIEPDANRNCLGDETQEGQPPPTSCDLTDPETKWVKRPPRKVRGHHVALFYTGTDRQSIFECRLDKRDWFSCASENGVLRVKSGRHYIQVRAVDEAANVDLTPIQAHFRSRP